MKTFAKITLAALGLSAGTFTAFSIDATPAPAAPATPARPGRLAAHPRLRAMMQRRAALRQHVAKKLDLSADQISQLRASRAATFSTIKGIRADTSLTPEQRRAKIRETLQATREKMRGTLSTEQQEKLGQMRERLQQFRRGKI